MAPTKDDARFFDAGRQSMAAGSGHQDDAKANPKGTGAAEKETLAEQLPSDEDRREGLRPDELNSANDK